jgi:hypothetical protein
MILTIADYFIYNKLYIIDKQLNKYKFFYNVSEN